MCCSNLDVMTEQQSHCRSLWKTIWVLWRVGSNPVTADKHLGFIFSLMFKPQRGSASLCWGCPCLKTCLQGIPLDYLDQGRHSVICASPHYMNWDPVYLAFLLTVFTIDEIRRAQNTCRKNTHLVNSRFWVQLMDTQFSALLGSHLCIAASCTILASFRHGLKLGDWVNKNLKRQFIVI